MNWDEIGERFINAAEDDAAEEEASEEEDMCLRSELDEELFCCLRALGHREEEAATCCKVVKDSAKSELLVQCRIELVRKFGACRR